jgi:predicted negative regulator of RcsB-dependent stress response
MNESNTHQNKSGFFNNLMRFLSESRRLLVILLLAIIIYLGYQLATKTNESSTLEYDTNLIQQQIKNVGKLVVTEGHFSEVITYKDQKKYLLDVLSFEKKALVVVNAEVTVSFDLSKITYDIDAPNKTLTIKFIPKEEIKIYPDFKYYDMEQSKLNEFAAEDYNKINKTVRANLAKKIEQSTLKTNAKNRLISELYNMLILTKSMGWKLEYNGEEINSESDFSARIKG